MTVLIVLFLVVLVLASILTVLNQRDLSEHLRDDRGWWPGSRRPR